MKDICAASKLKFDAELAAAIVSDMQQKRAAKKQYLIDRTLKELGIDCQYLEELLKPITMKLLNMTDHTSKLF